MVTWLFQTPFEATLLSFDSFSQMMANVLRYMYMVGDGKPGCDSEDT